MSDRVSFELKGTTRLLMHSDDVLWADELKVTRAEMDKELTIRGDDRSPPWSWLGCMYDDGEFVTMPAANLAACLRAAGATMLVPGKGKKTYKEASQSGLSFIGEHLTFTNNGKQVPIAPLRALRKLGNNPEIFSQHQATAAKHGFELYVKRAKVGAGKHVRVRPMFKAWIVTGEVDVELPDVLTTDVLRDLFCAAGRKGLGDWRPGCRTPGTCGQFVATLKRIK